ncbi:MAG TPA: hypothetical protein VG713_00530, partial [Pirellulales bacterium]|nr:hypothetical protein [Pirellulales bacterium]
MPVGFCFWRVEYYQLLAREKIRQWSGPMGNVHIASREKSEAISNSRRDFLRVATKLSAASALSAFAPLRALAAQPARKVVVVTFGGGARDEETFAPDGQKNIPHLLNELIPQAT